MADVLIAGVTGGREHALGEVIANGGEHQVTFSHGNPGTEGFGTNLGLSTNQEIVEYCEDTQPGLVVVGPEAPLVEGLADELRQRDILVFGPSAEGAKLESSKAYAVEFMQQYGIPHPESFITSSRAAAQDYIFNRSPQLYVIKADGLAGGKGVKLTDSYEESEVVVNGMMSGYLFGDAGKTIVFQDRRRGPEISAFLVADGDKFKLVGVAQDHKRLLDNDEGENTGGMGAYLDVPFVDESLIADINDIGEKTMYGLKDRGIDYRGVLYLGLMLDEENGGKPTMMEYNVRFGDPETQPLFIQRFYAGLDSYALLQSAASGDLIDEPEFGEAGIHVDVATICLAAFGYPASPRKGDEIFGLDKAHEGVFVHHAGTKRDGRRIITAGGRVLYLSGVGESVDEAAGNAERAIGKDGIHFAGMQYRTDIGRQARTKI